MLLKTQLAVTGENNFRMGPQNFIGGLSRKTGVRQIIIGVNDSAFLPSKYTIEVTVYDVTLEIQILKERGCECLTGLENDQSIVAKTATASSSFWSFTSAGRSC